MFAPKQVEFLLNSTKRWNIAHGSVRSGKTVCSIVRFLEAVDQCPDSAIWMVGHSSNTIFDNAVSLILESPQLAVFRPFCTWFAGKRELKYKDKTIKTLGARDEGAIGSFQGKTFSLAYCDEITLYPESIIDMIDTRLSMPYSMGIATCNPSHPDHKVKKWINKAREGDPAYYELSFRLEDNPFVDDEYRRRIKGSLSGLFYRRNYLGEWCLAEGAIFDFFDRNVHVVQAPPVAAEYWVAGIDYGTANAFACVIMGVASGKYTQAGKQMWIEKEYYWDSRKTHRQKLNSEYARDIEEFLEPYGVTKIYIDPSAASFSLEMRRKGFAVIAANNNVGDGIQIMANAMATGTLKICAGCTNLIREIEGYVWDERKAREGIDAPVKRGDHAVDSVRYLLSTHIVTAPYDQAYVQAQQAEAFRNRYNVTR